MNTLKIYYDLSAENPREMVDSCWGFYGDNFLENGMLDSIDTSLLGITDEELKTLLKTIEPVFE